MRACLLLLSIACLVSSCGAPEVPSSATTARSESEPLSSTARVRAAIEQHLVTHPATAEIAGQPRSEDDIRALIESRLDPRLLASAPKLGGADFRIAIDDETLHLGALALAYATSGDARAAAALLGQERGIFAHTEILTPYRAVIVSNTVIVVFSESSLHPLIESFLASAPALLAPSDPAVH